VARLVSGPRPYFHHLSDSYGPDSDAFEMQVERFVIRTQRDLGPFSNNWMPASTASVR
jgi:hypothetical protein